MRSQRQPVCYHPTLKFTKTMWKILLPLILLTGLVNAQAAKPGLLLVVSQGDQTLSIFDPDAGTKLAVLKTTGVRAHEVVASPDGKFAYLPIYGNSGVGKPGTDGRTIEIVDLEKRKITSTMDLGRPTRSHCAKFGPDGLLYVTSEVAQSIDVIDPHKKKIVASIATQRPESHMLVISSDGKRGYTSNVGNGTVTALDLAARKPYAVIPVADVAQRIALSVDDRWVFTADQKQPRLAVIDTSTLKVVNWIPLPAIGYGSAPTADGNWLLVALPSAKQVAVVDLAEMKVARTVAVPEGPQEILMRPDASVAYVSCNAAAKVAVIDLNKWSVEKTLDAGPGADGLGWAVSK